MSNLLQNKKLDLLLIFVAYHPSADEVKALKSCLISLPSNIGYAIVSNDYKQGEPVDLLISSADLSLKNYDNPGYGRAVNRLVSSLVDPPPYIGVLNTDLTWPDNTFEALLTWLQSNTNVSLAVPQILDNAGSIQKLCKLNPSVLALLSRRFVPQSIKPSWLHRYDKKYVMNHMDYTTVFEVKYLSGCCMLMKTSSFVKINGFDENFFLYLEDADITRRMSEQGLCVHLPIAHVVHQWGKGNYVNFKLMLVNLISAWTYFNKWGWKLF